MHKDRKDKNKKAESNLIYFGKIAFYLLAGYLLFFTSIPDYIDHAIDSMDPGGADQFTEAVEQAPISVQAQPTPTVPKKKVKESCEKTIKGNISSSGEKIYHVPGGDFYDETVAEDMFCTQAEAVTAGYRKSKR